MSLARTLARKVFGRSIEVNDLQIAFHKEANLYGTHGLLLASHVDQGLKNVPVRFVFVGLSEAPPLTPVIMSYVWEEAKAQGYVPHALSAYGLVLETHTGLKPRDLIAKERREAEDANSGRVTIHRMPVPKGPTTIYERTVARSEAEVFPQPLGQPLEHDGMMSTEFVGKVPNAGDIADKVLANAAAYESGKTRPVIDRNVSVVKHAPLNTKETTQG